MSSLVMGDSHSPTGASVMSARQNKQILHRMSTDSADLLCVRSPRIPHRLSLATLAGYVQVFSKKCTIESARILTLSESQIVVRDGLVALRKVGVSIVQFAGF